MKTCYDILLGYASGKEVLDIGSCGNQGEQVKSKTLFASLKNVAKDVTGLDIESNDPEIIKGNAETITLGKQFEIVVAGDVIEHLHNPGLFLGNMHKHLKKDGLLIVVTPNVKAPAYLLFRGNKFHTCWYCRHTLKYLVEQHGFKAERIFIGSRRRRNFFYDLFRNYCANNLLFICRKIEKSAGEQA